MKTFEEAIDENPTNFLDTTDIDEGDRVRLVGGNRYGTVIEEDSVTAVVAWQSKGKTVYKSRHRLSELEPA